MFPQILAVTRASLALFAGVGTTAASAKTTTAHASQAVTQSNGRLMKYAVGLLPRRGDFKPMAVAVSDQRIGLRLTGSRARDVLAKGGSLDLHPRVFGAGRAAQTTVGLAGVVLLALSGTGDDFLLLVRSSFAGYLAEWLLDAALEYTASSPASALA